MLALQPLAGGHEIGRCAEREARRDGVEVPAPAVVALDQPLAVAIEVVGAVDIVRRRQAVDAGEARDQPHVATTGLVEQLFGGDR